MLINVSTLLTEPVGHARRYHVAREPVAAGADGDGAPATITGDVRLIRSERGVIVMATLELTPVTLDCARCTAPFDTTLTLVFDEEYVLERDTVTGGHVDAGEDEFRIDARRHLDLSEAVRQYGVSAVPIQPLCGEACRGLCPRCGQNLNQGACGCAGDPVDRRWSALASLADRLRAEETDGRPET